MAPLRKSPMPVFLPFQEEYPDPLDIPAFHQIEFQGFLFAAENAEPASHALLGIYKAFIFFEPATFFISMASKKQRSTQF